MVHKGPEFHKRLEGNEFQSMLITYLNFMSYVFILSKNIVQLDELFYEISQNAHKSTQTLTTTIKEKKKKETLTVA